MSYNPESFKEHTNFQSVHSFLNLFQSKDFNDSIIQLEAPSIDASREVSTSPTNSKGSTRLNFDPKQYYHHLEQLPQAQPQLQPQFTEQFQILNLNKDLCERNTATRTNKKKLRTSGNILTADQISRTSCTSPALMSPVFTNDLLSPSPELDLLEFEEDDDDDEEDDEEALFDGDYNENGNRVNRWNQDDIFQLHDNANENSNPAAHGLFPRMDLSAHNNFMDIKELPLDPVAHKRQ